LTRPGSVALSEILIRENPGRATWNLAALLATRLPVTWRLFNRQVGTRREGNRGRSAERLLTSASAAHACSPNSQSSGAVCCRAGFTFPACRCPCQCSHRSDGLGPFRRERVSFRSAFSLSVEF